MASLFLGAIPWPSEAGEKQPRFGERLAYAALERTYHRVRYDPSYVVMDYPGGDVPAEQGVCTDVVVRSYRKLGIDLQQLVHKDMSSNFHLYPNLAKWELDGPDPNIDHRRVLNLRTFFSRYGENLPVTDGAQDYRPGDLVTWRVPPDLPHIGIVSNRRGADGKYMIIHNIGDGPKLEDRLFDFPITGHYRFSGVDETFPVTTPPRVASDRFLFADHTP
jgi:uncharacterized protein YijF (DUF1287 family)